MNYFFFFFSILVASVKIGQGLTLSRYFHLWFSEDRNDLEFSSIYPSIQYLDGKNVSEVVATEKAFAVRIALQEEDNLVTTQTTRRILNIQADASHEVLNYNRSLAPYVVFGVAEYGGAVHGAAWDLLRPKNEGMEDFDSEFPQNGHVIQANDVCALADAFVAIIHKKVVCWGSQQTCTGWEFVTGNRSDIHVVKVFCPRKAYVALAILSEPHPEYKSYLSMFGNPTFGFYPPNSDFLQVAAKVDSDGILEAVANQDAVALLLPGRIVMAFGNALHGGHIPQPDLTVFVKKIVANRVGFAVLKETGSVVTWGAFTQQYVPNRIKDEYIAVGNNMVEVEDIIVSDECFIALMSDKTVTTWGDGADLYCTEYGAVSSPSFVPFKDVKNQLKDVIRIVTTKDAFCAIRKNGSVVTWGHKKRGAVISPGTPLSPTSNLVSPCSVIPESAQSTEGAFGIICTDASVALWGDAEAGAALDTANSQLLTLTLGRMKQDFLVVDFLGGVFLVSNDRIYGYWSHEKPIDDPSQHHLSGPITHLFTTSYGALALFGRDCVLSEMSEWSPCSKRCGRGRRSRRAVVDEFPVNGWCNEKVYEEQSCIGYECSENTNSSVLSSIRFTHILMFLVVSLLFILLLIWIFYLCLSRRRRRNPYM